LDGYKTRQRKEKIEHVRGGNCNGKLNSLEQEQIMKETKKVKITTDKLSTTIFKKNMISQGKKC